VEEIVNDHHFSESELHRLITIHRRHAASHKCTVSAGDYSKFEPKKDLLQKLSAFGNTIFTVYDMYSRKYLLKSEGFKIMLGYSNPPDVENDDMELFHSIIHPEDLPFVLDTENEAYDFFSSLPASEKKDYKLIYDFRVKNTTGVYMRFMHQFMVLEQDRSGKTWLVLVLTDLLTERATGDTPQRKMINLKTGRLHLFGQDDLFPAQKLLTGRETAVLILLSQGLDSRQISERLYISVHTVNNHRQHILHKTNTRNTAQALIYARRIGVI
jgi:DNA-binding CsgD family transcriptional regulator